MLASLMSAHLTATKLLGLTHQINTTHVHVLSWLGARLHVSQDIAHATVYPLTNGEELRLLGRGFPHPLTYY